MMIVFFAPYMLPKKSLKNIKNNEKQRLKRGKDMYREF